MKTTIGLVPAGLGIAMALALGAGSTWALAHRATTDGVLGLALAHELETTGLCANSLKLDGANDRVRLVQLLEQRLDSAVAQAVSLADQGARLTGAAPNLRDSVRRAASHYADTGELEKQRRAEALVAALNRSHE